MPDAYLDGLKMLARRELSEAQVRQRLVRRGHEESAIDDAVARLKQERAIDDNRVAAAIARTEAEKHRGRPRVRRKVESAGIDRTTARRAVDDVLRDVGDEVLLDLALAKRMRRRTSIDDDAEFRRLFRYLVGQGFDAEQVMKALAARRRKVD